MLIRTRIDRRGVALLLLALGGLLGTSSAVQADERTVDQLIAATKSSDEAARLGAIHELGVRGGEPAVPALIALLKSEAPIERAYAAHALGKIGPPAKGATEALLASLGDSDAAVRRQAIGALMAIKPGPKVGVPLFAKLMRDADPGIRLRVMQSIADAKGAAVPSLIEALKSEDAAYWACLILRDIGPDAAPAVPALVDRLKDSHPEVRREAALALGAIGSADAAPKLVPLLKDDAARTAATFALGTLGKVPPEAEATIRANIESKDTNLSTVSAWALARVRPQDTKLQQTAVAMLFQRLKDKNPLVRTTAARALASLPLNPEITAPAFEKALSDADETTTHYMLDALAGLGEPAVPKLIKALQYESLRPQVAYMLGQIGPKAAPATAALAELLDDEDPNAAIEAAHALAHIGPGAKAAVPALNNVLKDAQGMRAYAAAYALGMIGPDAAPAEPTLLAIVKDTDNSLSLISAWAYIKIRGASSQTAATVMPELLADLKSQLPKAREGAADVLASLGAFAKGALPQLQQATKDADPAVRAAAAKAIEAINGKKKAA